MGSRVKHFKVVSSLPTTLEPDSIYYVRVGTGFDLYTTTSSTPVIARPLNMSSYIGAERYYNLRKGSNIKANDWFLIGRDNNWQSGSWDGYENSYPFSVDYDCKISKIKIRIGKKIKFYERTTPGPLYLDIGFLDHNYDTAFNEKILRFTLDGSFIGTEINDTQLKYFLTESDISVISGANYFTENELIGCIMRNSDTTPGLITETERSYHSITFEGV